jgi:hypothetical protein
MIDIGLLKWIFSNNQDFFFELDKMIDRIKKFTTFANK